MRIRVLHRPTRAAVDGIDLKHFVPGQAYDVGTSLGALMLAEGWAAPVVSDSAQAVPSTGADSFTSRTRDGNAPPNLIRETHPPTADDITMAADFARRKRPRPGPER
jgi:hypothetical protein